MSESPPNILEQIKEALFDGRKIEAIKLYREARGVGLKEAKDHVEKLEEELRQNSPEKFRIPAGKGCLGALVALAGLLAVLFITCARLATG